MQGTKKSMLNAKVNHKCNFAKIVIEEFLKYEWKNKHVWDEKDLWVGDVQGFELGRTAMMAMNKGRNAMSTRVIKTVGEL